MFINDPLQLFPQPGHAIAREVNGVLLLVIVAIHF